MEGLLNALLWMTPAAPLAAAALIAMIAGSAAGAQGSDRHARAQRRLVTVLAAGGVTFALASSLTLLAAAWSGRSASASLPWLEVGNGTFGITLRLDPLTALASALVTAVAAAVFMYAAAYMRDEALYGRFFALLSLFVAAMLALVAADDVLLLFAAWEVVGACSYFLIGFWFERPGVARAGSQAFLVTRIGDVALLAGILLLASATETGSISAILEATRAGALETGTLITAAGLLFVGAMGKSAQVPLHGWLPDAMAGPTPVSALIHSATMVAAGVYLVARFLPLFDIGGVLPLVGWVGAVTALLGAAAALGQTDLKRLLAYSTMSQLGFMFVALGAGSVAAAVLLLVAQGASKALLFLAAGNVGHAVHATHLQAMGGLRPRMPSTFALFALGTAGLVGLPITIAWPAKDGVLSAAWQTSRPTFAVALVATLLTALYAVRALTLAFLGSPRSEAAAKARESPAGLLAPMLALGVLVVGAGTIDSPLLGRPLERLLDASVPEVALITGLVLLTVTVGLLAGVVFYIHGLGALRSHPLRAAAAAAEAGFGVQALYGFLTRSGAMWGDWFRRFDQRVFDPVARGAARTATRAAVTLARIDTRAFIPLGDALALAVRRAAAGARRTDALVFDRLVDAMTRHTLAILQASRRFDIRRVDAVFDALATSVSAAGQRLRVTTTGRVYNYFVVVFVWGLGALATALFATAIRAHL